MCSEFSVAGGDYESCKGVTYSNICHHYQFIREPLETVMPPLSVLMDYRHANVL